MITCNVFTSIFSSKVGCMSGKIRNRAYNEEMRCFKMLFISTNKFFWEATVFTARLRYLENGGSRVLRNIVFHLPNDTVPSPRILY